MKYKKSKMIIGAFLTLLVGISFASAQINQSMRGSVLEVGNAGDTGPFGDCNAVDPACQLRYEYWSVQGALDTSAEINKDVTGIPQYRKNIDGTYRARSSNIQNYPISGVVDAQDWFQSWFGELFRGTGDHTGYYSVMSQKVNFGETGNDLSSTCDVGCVAPGDPGCRSIACYFPTGPAESHSVTLADGTVLEPLGGLSPIPVPRSQLQLGTLVAQLEWDEAGNSTTTDVAPGPITGYRIWAAEDTVNDCDFPAPTVADYREIGDVSGVDSVSTDVGLGSLNPAAEAVYFAIQLLYRSSSNPNDSFERRSGFNITPILRAEGLSANGNLLVLLALVENFQAVDGTGNQGIISWDSALPGGCDIIDFFRIDATKDATGLGSEPTHSGASYIVPFDGSSTYSVADGEAGRGGSKVNIYTITVVLTDGTEIVVDTIVYAHKGKTN